MKTSEHIQTLLRTLPDNPGVYQYFDEEEKLLYVGKAKNLKKRVSSYFNKDNYENGKTQVLVKKIANIKYIIVNTELDALLLENTLIKKYQPRYNISLKDDKTYPWICIKNERFPRIFPTRNVVKDGSQYFGPYASVKVMNTVLDLIKQLYDLRNCNLNLTEENILAGKFKVCLEYHLGNCKGPCVAKETEEEYNQTVAEIKEIIKGNAYGVARHLKALMQQHIEKMEFEKAQAIKEKIDLLEKFQSKSTVVNPSISNIEVFSIISDDKAGYVNFLKVMNGAIMQGHTIEMKKKLDETDQELLTLAIAELRERFNSDSKEIIVPFEIETEFSNVTFLVPQRGDKKQLLELSQRNVDYYRKEKMKQESLVDPERHTKRILEQMKKDLHLQEEPRHIECFDNSNFQGAYPVAAMTVFKDAKPSKKDYRHFNIKTVEGPDDFASMEEIIYRRYKRVLDENQSLPQLIVIDGGKGQLSAALESLEKLGLRGKVGIIGIAKRLEEIYFPNDPIPLYLDKRSESLKIIQQIRDEAHRFGITHHRSRRDKGTLKTELTEIAGISTATAQKLLSHFKSVKKVKEATEAELAEVIGKAKGKTVYDHYNQPDRFEGINTDPAANL
ncbi:MAG TPA: excinuclease ABC subunit UvrC [Bacteroidia bacterium]|nr:excinuclease ABC subunit UvrC [Bacteroidia bacterium]